MYPGTILIYHKSEEALTAKFVCYISDDLEHNVSILCKVMNELRPTSKTQLERKATQFTTFRWLLRAIQELQTLYISLLLPRRLFHAL